MEIFTKTKRISVMLIMGLFVLLFLSACSTGEESDTEASAKDQTQEEGTLRVLRLSDATNLDPHFITNISTANILYEKVYETLVKFDKDMEIIPGLATKWEQVDDVTWEFELQEGVEFHDGTPFTAEAVKVTFERLLDPETGSPQADKLGMIEEINVLDDYKVQLKLEAPYAGLLAILASSEGSIMSPKVLQEDPDSLANNPVGTGPFVFESWNSGKDITLMKNEDYWGHPVKIDKVVFEVVPEASTRLAMIETGEAHITDTVPVTEIERVQESEQLNLYRTEGLAVTFIGFNMEKSPVDNLKLRQAVSHAIDREVIVEGVYNNVGALSNSAMSPKVTGYSENIEPYEFNVNKAKALMEEAGLDTGVKLSLVTNDDPQRINLAEVFQSQLKGIGIDLEIHVLEFGAYTEARLSKEHDMYIGGWGNATGDGDYNQYNLFHSSSHGSSGNYFFYSNEENDELIEAGRQENDLEKRKEIYEKSMRIQMEDAVYIPLISHEHLAVYNDNVDGFWMNAVSYLILDEVSVSK